jgi:hypothetical protein
MKEKITETFQLLIVCFTIGFCITEMSGCWVKSRPNITVCDYEKGCK